MPNPVADSLPRLKRLLPRLKGRRIGVLGDLMLDRYLWGTASRLSPEAAVPVDPQECSAAVAVSHDRIIGHAGAIDRQEKSARPAQVRIRTHMIPVPDRETAPHGRHPSSDKS